MQSISRSPPGLLPGRNPIERPPAKATRGPSRARPAPRWNRLKLANRPACQGLIVGQDVDRTPRVMLLDPAENYDALGRDEPGHPRRDLFLDVFLLDDIRIS